MDGFLITENGLKSSCLLPRDKLDCNDTEDDEEEDRAEQSTVTTSVADLCSASHEFEWLSPRNTMPEKSSRSSPFPNSDRNQTNCNDQQPGLSSPFRSLSPRSRPERLPNNNGGGVYSDLPTDRQHSIMADEHPYSCQMSPSRSIHKHYRTPHVWPRRSDVLDQMRMSPSPYNELHGCRRHLSPMRSSWCCPSPPHPICAHHNGMELVQCSLDCCGSADLFHLPYQNCACLPPLPHHYHETHNSNWSPHHEIVRRESSSPCAMHRPGQGSHRRSRSTTSKKRDVSPSALSPRYSPVHNERNSGQELWQVPVHSEDANHLQRVQDLESDKKNLILQVSVLTDQVEAQAEKITELEKLLDQKKEELMRIEHSLHEEMMTRSSMENGKLELLTELSNLRLRLSAAEKDRKESDEKCRKLENELLHRLSGQELEQSSLKGSLTRNGPRLVTSKDTSDIVSPRDDVFDNILLSTSFNSDALKLSTNKVKATLNRAVTNASSIIPSELRKTEPTYSPPVSSTANALVLHRSNSVENISQPVVTLPNSQYGTMPRQSGSNVLQHLQSRFHDPRLDSSLESKTSILKKTEFSGNSSLFEYSKPKNLGIQSGKSSGVSFGKGFFKLRTGKRSSSEPYLEKEAYEKSSPSTPQPFSIKTEKDKKGLMKFFSKFKKSGSQNIDPMDGEFKRGGIRATAGPRLGWSRDLPQEPDMPFPRWNTDMIVEWFHRLGLSMYASECKKWMCTGDILSKATANDLEKDLGMKNPLHKKKLLLAVKSLASGGVSQQLPPSIHSLDYHWVVRWLDDVGLPQYKDAFADARVDGRVLHCITVDDLLFLKVTSQLHHVSISRGIQLLREKGFDPHCLVRRSLPDENKTYTPDLVALWSNHRVMEWLRTVDLSEYAPNLRGSGVHGALIVYEPKFNSNLFATLLNIPPTKTLLRRHLATHFKHIVGDELMQVKREKETEVPLSPSVKIKAVRKQFALKKKRNKHELDNEDYVCPMDIPIVLEASKVVSEGEKLVVRRNSDPSPQEQKRLDLMENTVERITALKDDSSCDIILSEGNLSGVPSTIV